MGFYIKYILLIALLLFLKNNFAQNEDIPILEKQVTLSYDKASIPGILNEMSRQAGFVFSYSPGVIESFGEQTISVEDKPVRHVLNTLFKGKIKYEERGKYLIIKRKEIDRSREKKKEMVIEGYLYDSETGDILTDASIYDAERMISSLSDDYGYFKLEVPAQEDVELKVSKSGYSDYNLQIIEPGYKYVQVELSETKPIHTDLAGREISQMHETRTIPLFSERLVSREVIKNIENIKEPIFTQYQFSLFPGLSTNRLLSANMVNKFSLNLTLGYVKGVEILELGGIGNVVIEDAGMVQAAGIYNIVGGVSTGLQASGIFNRSGGLDGVQVAGISNTVSGNGNSLQAAGIYNICHSDFTGLQTAGIFNKTGNIIGMQASGIYNHINDNSEATQLAGVFNISDTITGFQVGGVFNKAESIKGMQIAGVFNKAKRIEGTQISGVFNSARYIKGSQIGLINVADTCEGVPLGLLSIVRKGYNKLDIYANEIFYTNVSFRSGVRKFYNIILTGFLPSQIEESLWTAGYGIGTSLLNTENFSLALEAKAQNITSGSDFSSSEMLYKPGIDASISLTPKTSLVFSAYYNFLHTTAGSEDHFNEIMPYTLSDKNVNNENSLKTWVGGKIGLRFF